MFADFFGVPAATTTSFARIALHTGAPIIPGFLVPLPHGRYRMKFLPALELVRTGDMNRDVVLATELFNRVLESIIREHPESWLWGHKRWKNQPPGSPDLYALSARELDAALERLKQQRAQAAARDGHPALTDSSAARGAAP